MKQNVLLWLSDGWVFLILAFAACWAMFSLQRDADQAGDA